MITKRAADPTEPPPQSVERGGWWSVAAALLVLVVAGLSAWTTVPGSVPEDAGADEFDAHRAIDRLDQVAGEPRVPGEAAHREARDLLVTEFDRLGWQTEVHESIGMYTEGSTTVPMAAVDNVVATLPGTDPTGTMIIAAHYDSVPGAPGAADDGIGVATALEVARAVTASGAAPRNDIVVLLTDAEEPGLLGAEAFTHDRAEGLGDAVVVNLEARGNRGMPVSVRLTQPNSVLFDLLAETPEPVVDSFSDALFAVLENNTDMARFAEAGLYGFDTAITGGGAYYHTPLDDVDHLSAESLQQMGEGTLAFTRAAAEEDLSRVPDGVREIGVSHPGGVVSYPEGLELPLAVAAAVLGLLAAAVARVRGAVTLPRLALATLVGLLLPALAALVPVGVWQAATSVDPAQRSAFVGDPYVLWPYALSCVAGVLALVIGVRVLLRRALPGPTFALGGLVGLGLLGLLMVTVLPSLPGLATPVVLPVLPVALAAVVTMALPPDRLVVRRVVLLVSVLPAAVLVSPAVVGMFEVGMATGAPIAGPFLVLLVLLGLVPVDAGAGGAPGARRLLRTPLVLLVVMVLAGAAGLLLNREGATDPRQELISYSVDPTTETALWASWSPSGSDWSTDLMGDPVDPLADQPWLGGGDLANGPAPVTDLAAPTAEVTSDRVVDGERTLEFDLVSERDAPAVGMWLAADVGLESATVAGREVPVGSDGAGFGFLLRGSSEPVRVELVLDSADPVRMQVADLTHDLSAVEGFEPPPRGRMLVTPNVYVHRTIEV